MRLAPHWLISLLVALLLSADSRADQLPPAPDLSGNWSGRWESGSNSHQGPLRATFRRINDTQYRVVFRGRFWVVVPFRYAVTLDVVGQQGDRVLLAGSSRLGPIFGTFEYSAEATESDFIATFRSRNDHGVFVLTRCR
jgi:hypothetical protein